LYYLIWLLIWSEWIEPCTLQQAAKHSLWTLHSSPHKSSGDEN
jgi:hypothetical protein